MSVHFGIVMHRQTWDPLWRMFHSEITAETLPIQSQTSGGGKGPSIPYTEAWIDWLHKINNEDGARWLTARHTMLFNGDDWDAESIGNCHNFVSWDWEQNGYARLRTFWIGEDPRNFDPAKVNGHTRPDAIHKVICTNYWGRHANPGRGYDAYFPLMRKFRDLPVWEKLSRIERFPSLPYAAQVKVDSLNVRSLPDFGPKTGMTYHMGQKITLLEYRPFGASVWGRTLDGWVCLLLANQPNVRTFMTSWVLKTTGIIPPAVS